MDAADGQKILQMCILEWLKRVYFRVEKINLT